MCKQIKLYFPLKYKKFHFPLLEIKHKKLKYEKLILKIINEHKINIT